MSATSKSSVGKSPVGRRSRGFTLVELMAVILILAILIGVLVTQIGGEREVVKARLTRAFIAQIEAALTAYETDHGDYPASRFDDDVATASNRANLGMESLVATLWSDGWEGGGLSDESLVNTDGDVAKKRVTDFPNADLFELSDSWGNPIAYFHRTDYGREDVYFTYDGETGEPLESPVKARQNPKTGRYFQFNKYQLLSAGPDGRFGTEDDIANFEP